MTGLSSLTHCLPVSTFLLQALVAEQVQTVLGNPVGGDEPLMAAGLDSLGATELQQGLADALGMELPSTLVFDYPTINAMAEFLASKLGQAAAPANAAATSLTASSALAHSATAFSGSAGWAVAILEQHGMASWERAVSRMRAMPAGGCHTPAGMLTHSSSPQMARCRLRWAAWLASYSVEQPRQLKERSCMPCMPVNAFPLITSPSPPLALWCLLAGCGAV